MSNRFLDKLPNYYQEIKEFQSLSKTITAELNQVDQAMSLVENDQFILTSSEQAVLRREQDFGILSDAKIESLDFRKARLLTHMQSKPPYVFEYIKRLLDTLVGKENHYIVLDIDTLEMEVGVYAKESNYYIEAEKMIERIVPLNIDVTTSIILIREYLILKYGSYAFPYNYRITNKFRTVTVAGTR